MTTSDPQAGHPPTRLVLIRHGESQVTVDRVIGGFRTCSGLSPLGREQATRLRDRLTATGELAGGRLIASNFARAVETARIIAPAIGGAVAAPDSGFVVDEGFGEHDPGPDLDGIRFDDYLGRYGTPSEGAEIFPGGETYGAFRTRVEATLTRAVEAHLGEVIVVSCHGGVVDVAFRKLLQLPATGAFDLWTLNASITEFQSLDTPPADAAGPRWRLVRYNDAAHLAGLPTATPR